MSEDKVFSLSSKGRPTYLEFMRHYGARANEAIGLLKKNVFEDYLVISSVLGFRGNLRASRKKAKILPFTFETRWLAEFIN
jgi:hypothetical protein